MAEINEKLKKYLGKDYDVNQRKAYYDYIENLISALVKDWSRAPDTDKIAAQFSEIIKKLDDSDFTLLVLSSGYIPEFYAHDSSQETLYTKLIEVLVCEWATRIGFTDSTIQKQKASKEDVSIRLKEKVIVCDAKSYRLGRSQAAPNVKDTIKKADYDKWQEAYRGKEFEKGVNYKPIGGIITFPSLHRWKGKSDAYLYCTDKDDPISILYYEHMAFTLAGKFGHLPLISILENYEKLFPEKSRDQGTYFSTLDNCLFGKRVTEFYDFMKMAITISDELVAHKLQSMDTEIKRGKKVIEDDINSIKVEDFEKLKQRLIESETKLLSNQLEKQQINIKKFRPPSNGKTPIESEKSTD